VPSGLVILYATASGNAEQLALAAADRLAAAGHAAEVHNVADFPPSRLGGYATALFIVSTWGEGAAPPEAEPFCSRLAADEPLGLGALGYALLALGSSMYREFCAVGRRLDADLVRHGARRLLPRVDCDTKFKADFNRWLDSVLASLPLPS
jgi:sulfite reductase alpha subunit-like flavoprotein